MRGNASDPGAARCRGAASIEFVLAVMVVLPLAFAILEFAQLAVARHALNHAAVEAVRVGSVDGGDARRMRIALAQAMMPLFASSDFGSDAPTLDHGLRGLARATAELLRPDLASLTILSPGPAAFEDFGVSRNGEILIPNEGLGAGGVVGGASGQTLRQANVLAIRVRYCRELLFPWHAAVWPSGLRAPAFDLACRARGRLPIATVAAVQMQSPARRDALASWPGPGG